VSEQILNSTSTQLVYIVPFTSVHAVKYVTLQKLNTTQKKQTMQNTAEQTSLVQSHHTTLGQETRWAYSTILPSPHEVHERVE